MTQKISKKQQLIKKMEHLYIPGSIESELSFLNNNNNNNAAAVMPTYDTLYSLDLERNERQTTPEESSNMDTTSFFDEQLTDLITLLDDNKVNIEKESNNLIKTEKIYNKKNVKFNIGVGGGSPAAKRQRVTKTKDTKKTTSKNSNKRKDGAPVKRKRGRPPITTNKTELKKRQALRKLKNKQSATQSRERKRLYVEQLEKDLAAEKLKNELLAKQLQMLSINGKTPSIREPTLAEIEAIVQEQKQQEMAKKKTAKLSKKTLTTTAKDAKLSKDVEASLFLKFYLVIIVYFLVQQMMFFSPKIKQNTNQYEKGSDLFQQRIVDEEHEQPNIFNGLYDELNVSHFNWDLNNDDEEDEDKKKKKNGGKKGEDLDDDFNFIALAESLLPPKNPIVSTSTSLIDSEKRLKEELAGQVANQQGGRTNLTSVYMTDEEYNDLYFVE